MADPRLEPFTSALSVLAGFQDAVFVKDLAGRYLWVNEAAATLFGRPPEAILGKTSAELLGPAGSDFVASDAEVFRTGEAITLELPLVVDGEPRTKLVSKAALRDAGGEVVGLVGVGRDITARKRTEGELRRRAALLAEAQRIAHLGSWEWDIVRNRIRWSRELYELFGVDPLNFEGTYESYLALLPAEERPAVDAVIREALATRGEYSIEHRLIRPDGETRTILGRGRVLTDVDGSAMRLVGAALDVTDVRRQAEIARASQAQLAAAEDLAGIGSFVWDIGADRVVWSDNLYRIFGCKPGEFPGTYEAYIGFLHPDERDERQRTIAELLEKGGAMASEHRIVRSDGEVRWISSRLRVLCDEHGVARSLTGACQDVTARKRAELALRAELGAARSRALVDPLTGLANRTLAYDRLRHALAARSRTGADVGVLFCDIDGFKRVNDSAGHAAGDRVLAVAAARLLEIGRESDTLARIGGDEFLVVCEQIDGADDALALARRLADRFCPPGEGPQELADLALSIGVSVAAGRDLDADTLIAEADAAMYVAKGDPGRAVVLHEPG